MRESDWKALLASLSQGNCVALVGPGLAVTTEDGSLRSITDELSRELAEGLNTDRPDEPISDADAENLSLVAQCYADRLTKDLLLEEVTQFYRDHGSRLQTSGAHDPALQALASLPIKLFVNARHDYTVQHFLKAQGKAPIEKAYEFNGDQQRSIGNLGTPGEPLVYNVLGAIENPRSLALTEDDLLCLLEAIIAGNPALPNDLRNEFSKKSFLFLGCGLHTYYIRVLLHSLGLNESAKPSFAPDSSDDLHADDEIRSSVWFYEVGYKSLRLLDIEERDFLVELGRRWTEKAGSNGLPASTDTGTDEDTSEQPTAFISYVSEDQTDAERLAGMLNAKGVNTWLDQDDLRGGRQWDLELKNAIKAVDFFIVLLSENLGDYVETYVHKEISYALDRLSMKGAGVSFIYPVRFDDAASRLRSLDEEKIQVWNLFDMPSDINGLASDVKRQYAKIQRR